MSQGNVNTIDNSDSSISGSSSKRGKRSADAQPAQVPEAAGAFCWVDLCTADAAGARDFYGAVFGWGFETAEMPDGSSYETLQLTAGPLGGLMPLDAATQKDVPSHWSSYIAVADVDGTVARAAELGATVVQAPFDVGGVGRMSIIADPTGARLSLWQPKSIEGGAVSGKTAGTWGWQELHTDDIDRAGGFYGELFGWTTKLSDDGEYTTFMKGEQMVGGMMQIKDEMPVPPHWGLYFSVADCDETVGTIEARGGRVLMPPTDIAMVGRIAWVADPQGASFALIAWAE